MEPKLKREMLNEREEKMDRLSMLPDSILLYIMASLTTKEAVHTCILSKRWKDLWKYLPTLVASNEHFQRAEFFKRFIYKVLQHRDGSSAFHNIAVDHNGYIHAQISDKIVSYAMSHDVKQFTFDAYIRSKGAKNALVFGPIFSSHALKHLDVSFRKSRWLVKLPHTLDLPEVEKCHLKYVSFSSSDNDFAKPFSLCKKLSTLVIDNCNLHNAKVLCVSGDKLTNLTIRFGKFIYSPFKAQVCAPNLKSFTFVGHVSPSNNHKLFEHHLDFLEEACIEALCVRSSPKVFENILNSWMRSLSNVHSLTVGARALKDLASTLGFPNTDPARFPNLRSLIVKRDRGTPVLDEELQYILQNSPVAETTIIEATPSYEEEYEVE